MVFCSQIQVELAGTELLTLLRKAYAYNLHHNITGLLLYRAGQFVAVLEGAPEVVRPLFERIRRDTRHRSVLLLSDGTSAHRAFPDWRMGFAPAPFEALREPLPGYLNPEAPTFLRHHAPGASPYLLHLLQDFVAARPEEVC